MMSRPRFIFVIFYLTLVLIATVYLRTASSRYFYNYRIALVTQNHLGQQLRQKQLEFEGLINPAAIFQGLKEDGQK